MELTTRQRVIAALTEKSPQTCYQLAKLLDLQPASLSSKLVHMVRDGQIERRIDRNNPKKGMQYWIAKPQDRSE